MTVRPSKLAPFASTKEASANPNEAASQHPTCHHFKSMYKLMCWLTAARQQVIRHAAECVLLQLCSADGSSRKRECTTHRKRSTQPRDDGQGEDPAAIAFALTSAKGL